MRRFPLAVVAAALTLVALAPSGAGAAEKDAGRKEHAADKCRGIDMLAETAAKRSADLHAASWPRPPRPRTPAPSCGRSRRKGAPPPTCSAPCISPTSASPPFRRLSSRPRRREGHRARSFRSDGERHRLGDRPVGTARHVHRRAPPRHAALQHRVRHGQIDHRPLRHAGRHGGGVQAVDRHHDPVGVGLRAHQGAERGARARHEDRRDRQIARPSGCRPRDHPGAARSACRRSRAAADRHAARQPEVRRPHPRSHGDAGAALSQPQDHRGDAVPDRAGQGGGRRAIRRSSASRKSCSSSAT